MKTLEDVWEKLDEIGIVEDRQTRKGFGLNASPAVGEIYPLKTMVEDNPDHGIGEDLSVHGADFLGIYIGVREHSYNGLGFGYYCNKGEGNAHIFIGIKPQTSLVYEFFSRNLEFGLDERENFTTLGKNKKPVILVNTYSGCLSDKDKENYMKMLGEADLVPEVVKFGGGIAEMRRRAEERKKKLEQARQKNGRTIHRMIFPWS